MTKFGNIDIAYTNVKGKSLSFVKNDIFGQVRDKIVIGALQNKGEDLKIIPASYKNCGPLWYNPNI